jgi:hypothetical protein
MPQNSIHVRLSRKQLAALDEYRRDQLDLPSKPEALRRALQQAIAARQEDEAGDAHREVAAA